MQNSTCSSTAATPSELSEQGLSNGISNYHRNLNHHFALSRSLDSLKKTTAENSLLVSTEEGDRPQFGSNVELSQVDVAANVPVVIFDHVLEGQQSKSMENFADFSIFDSPTAVAKMARNPPTTLATVLENMPLVYNSSTKNLEKSKENAQEKDASEADSSDSSPEMVHKKGGGGQQNFAQLTPKTSSWRAPDLCG